MAKVITISRVFMQGHPKAGQPTLFVEKIWNSLLIADIEVEDYIYEVGKKLGYQYADDCLYAVDQMEPKHHTIRGSKLRKTGDKVSLRIWSGKPYRSPQIIIAPDVTLTVKDIEISGVGGWITINGKEGIMPEILAKNDGLSEIDLAYWFGMKPFSGQLLIWNDDNLPY